MRAVAYLRVSTQDQSLIRQHEDIKTFASRKGLKLDEIFEDKISGSKTNSNDREGFNDMEKYIELNEDIRDILILEISRLGRKNNDIQNIIEKYTEKGINIHINDLDISTLDKNGNRSFAAEMMISMLGVMASNESRLLSSRISSGQMSRARKNLAFGGKIIGYKKDEEGRPVIDMYEAPMIKRIFELASEGLGMRSISSMIENEFDREISTGTLNGVIKNTFHKGERRYKDLVLDVPPIVSEELWQKANDSVASRKKFGSRANVNTNIISGKITCTCGNVMHQKVIPQGRIDSFVCKDTKCKNSINRPWLFRMIRKIVERHAQKTRDKQVREKMKLEISACKATISINLKQLEKLNKRKIKARVEYLDDDEFSKEEYNLILSEIKKDIIQIKENNIKLNDTIRNFENSLKNEIKHFSEDLEIFRNEIQDIVRHVIIEKESVLINLYGWGEYDLNKPNSIKLGWEARKPESERYQNEGLPLRHPITDEDLDLFTRDYIENA
ncbi:recombinase family protein [Salinimicrobium sp. TIG7-5_MAKvit]|uniref:recombinase family protein n=1 Tax=Salinimicrobium sp. TIG7-5_MAKvit TaxID=3121289 RepID=UPI003C6E08DE